jgi:hypothetical protein
MPDFSKMLEELKTQRDELRLKIHLGSQDAQDEFKKLEAKWDEFSKNAGLEETTEGLGEALSSLGSELKSGFERLKKAL